MVSNIRATIIKPLNGCFLLIFSPKEKEGEEDDENVIGVGKWVKLIEIDRSGLRKVLFS